MTEFGTEGNPLLPIEDLRRNYTLAGLDESDLDPDPMVQFRQWFETARAAGLSEPNAMTLATADREGRPSARTVLLKEIDAAGFVFYTNYQSRKGRELAENPRAALVFYWAPLERQVRIEGKVERVSSRQSDAYFDSRPKGSRLGALVSPQSCVVPNRKAFEQKLLQLEEEYAGTDHLPRPEWWGGYCVRPESVEFWQGRPNRLHDRLRYVLQDGGWKVERLAP